ncbi:DUF192 domain-containing protein [Pendulispora brunnea]|uniref:DUF192 domain-containing protein n=1 Tax=Pendulispora brunnea TaxID=2905690 RepID=A0ABZ2KG17_9BACT
MKRFLRSAAISVFSPLIVASACTRTPPEPTSTSAASSSPAAAAQSVSSSPSEQPARCILATPVTPPPAAAPAPAGRCPKDPNPHLLSMVDLSIETGRGPVPLKAELAHTEAETERGLMFRTQMPEEQGMLFDLGPRREHSFWMRNTCIPLDMLFIDTDGLIVGILENVPTLNDTERTVGCASSWVLEMNAGWCRRHGVRAGQTMKLPH